MEREEGEDGWIVSWFGEFVVVRCAHDDDEDKMAIRFFDGLDFIAKRRRAEDIM